MATKTTNYGLTKPEGSDFYDIGVQNDNMNIIDKQMKANAKDIAQLNSDKEWKTYLDDGIKIVTNNQCTIFYIRNSISLIGGNLNDQTLIDLPYGIVFKDEIFAPCEILDGSWTPCGNTGYVNGRNEKITVRCKDSASAGVVIATFVVPTSSIKFN